MFEKVLHKTPILITNQVGVFFKLQKNKKSQLTKGFFVIK